MKVTNAEWWRKRPGQDTRASLVLEDDVPGSSVSNSSERVGRPEMAQNVKSGYSRLVTSRQGKNSQSVNDTRDITQDGQQDVDEQVAIAAALKEDTQRREEDCKDDFANVAVRVALSAQVIYIIEMAQSL